MKRKILSAVLLMSLILSASCGSKPTETNTDKQTSADATSVDTTSADETTEARIEPILPDTRWDGYQFRVLTKGQTSSHWSSRDIAAESENGDTINDAVYKRNMKIYERFGVEMVDIASPNGTWDLVTPLRKSVLAASDDYDMVAGGFPEMVKNFASEGMLMELHDVPYIDLSKPWYDQKANEQLSIDGMLFATAGDMLIMDNDATLCVLFNKKLAEDYGFEDMYEMVNNGAWTIDRMTEYAKLVAKDLNGDGSMGEKDQWGNIGESLNTYAFMVGCDAMAASKNADDVPVFNVKNEHFYDAFTKAVNLNRDYQITMYVENFKSNDVWGEVIDPAFSEGRVLFNTAGLNRVTVFRSMDIDFGILPLPKYDEKQEKYNSMVSLSCSNSITIPVTADAERSGAIIEALSAESYYTLTPAYYDIVLKTKRARDEASSEMLDIIFDNRIFDIAYMYDWGGLIGAINSLKTDGTITSTVDSKLTAAEKALEKTLTAYSELG